MNRTLIAVIATALLAVSAHAQFAARTQDPKTQEKPAQQANSGRNPQTAGEQKSDVEDISGMYSFLKDGEFVQINLEEGNAVTGFVSRYGDSESDKDSFLDQFFSKGSFDGTHLTWTTKPVHNVWYEFSGTLEHAANKKPAQEGYRLLKGTLTEHSTDANKKDSARSREVEFKSFPEELEEQ